MSNVLDVCCFSFVSSLRLLSVDEYPQPNSGTLVKDVFGQVTPDGPIVALLLSYLGSKVGLICNNVGTDNQGKEILDLLSLFNILSTASVQIDLITPTSIVVCDKNGNRTWFALLSGVMEHLLTVDLHLMKSAKLTYIDFYRILYTASTRVIQCAIENGLQLFINLGGDPLSRQALEILQDASVAIVQTSLTVSSGMDPEEYALELLNSTKAEIVLVTLAEKGLVCVTSKEVLHIPAYTLQTVHSNGAGAAFSAGFAYGYVNKWALKKTLKFAAALGGLFCTVKNGFGKFSVDTVFEFIKGQSHSDSDLMGSI
jgi:sugar/nucleoside kinase (ribokinase family)